MYICSQFQELDYCILATVCRGILEGRAPKLVEAVEVVPRTDECLVIQGQKTEKEDCRREWEGEREREKEGEREREREREREGRKIKITRSLR